MFKKDILRKLIILITCFALIIGLCTWKSIVNNKAHYDIDRYNLLNEVKLTETSEQLLDIEQDNYKKYREKSFYDLSNEKRLNDNEKYILIDETIILNFNIDKIIEYFEKQKANGSDLTKGFGRPVPSSFLKFYNIFNYRNIYNSLFKLPIIEIKFSSTLINNILKYKDQLERFKKLEENSFTNFKQLNDILKTDFFDLNEFLLMLEGKDANNKSNKHYIKVRETLMRFYSILFKLYGEDKIKKLVFNFTQGSFESKNEKGEVAGVTVFSSNLFKQHIKLKNSVFCTKMCKHNYVNGFWSSFNCAYVLIHEMGHAIDNFFVLNQQQREKLHTPYIISALPLFRNIVLDPLYTYCSSASIKYDSHKNTLALQNHIYQSIIKPQFDINNLENNNYNSNFKKEALFVFAPSNYARLSDKENHDLWQKEFFAECFAYWISTPDKYRDIRWAIINDYFLNKFGQ